MNDAEEEHVPAWGDPDYGVWAERKRQELDVPNARQRKKKKTPHPVTDVEKMREEQRDEQSSI